MSEAIVAPKPKLGRPPKVRPSTEPPPVRPTTPVSEVTSEEPSGLLQWRVTTLVKEVERLQGLLEEQRQQMEALQTERDDFAECSVDQSLLFQVMDAARAIAADALAYVRPHAAGDLWNRWVAQWPWLPGSESDAGEPTAE